MPKSLVSRTVTPAMTEANRQNGRNPKGPVREPGKAMSRANAGKHWGRAEVIVGWPNATGVVRLG